MAAWLAATASALIWHSPPRPSAGRRTLELGPEPPAVANFLVHGFRVTNDAVPATLIDLAARKLVEIEQRGPGVFYVRLKSTREESSSAYERRVLDHLRTNAHDGVVPAEALTTGTRQESARWMRGFVSEVVSDAQARGLSREAVGGAIFTVLSVAAVVPAALIWALWDVRTGLAAFVVAVALLGWIKRRHPQRETPAGLDAASRWLGVRAELAENPVFATHSPLQVVLWDRLLAYGAALGVASGASVPLPMGAESDTHAWSAHGGRWRAVRIVYPNAWPPGWGKEPLHALLTAGVVAAGFGVFALLYQGSPLQAGGVAAFPSVLASFVLVAAVGFALFALADWGTAVESTGPVLRLRAFEERRGVRYYVAVDDGVSSTIRAFRVSSRLFEPLEQGDLVTLRHTRYLRCVRWIIPAQSGAALAG